MVLLGACVSRLRREGLTLRSPCFSLPHPRWRAGGRSRDMWLHLSLASVSFPVSLLALSFSVSVSVRERGSEHRCVSRCLWELVCSVDVQLWVCVWDELLKGRWCSFLCSGHRQLCSCLKMAFASYKSNTCLLLKNLKMQSDIKYKTKKMTNDPTVLRKNTFSILVHLFLYFFIHICAQICTQLTSYWIEAKSQW